MEKLTLDDLERMEADTLTPAQVAPLLGVNPNSLRCQVWDDPERLGFPVSVIGCRIRIPRLAFIEFMRGVSA